MVSRRFHLQSYLDSSHHTLSYSPSKFATKALVDVLFPYQVYLLSQSQDDIETKRTESLILKGYISALFSSCVRIITKTITHILESDVVPEVMVSLQWTQIGVLVPYVMNVLYLGSFSSVLTELLHSGIDELALLWCKLLTICRIQVLPNCLCHV